MLPWLDAKYSENYRISELLWFRKTISVWIDSVIAHETVLSIELASALTRLLEWRTASGINVELCIRGTVFTNVAFENITGVTSLKKSSKVLVRTVHMLRELEQISACPISKIVGRLCNKWTHRPTTAIICHILLHLLDHLSISLNFFSNVNSLDRDRDLSISDISDNLYYQNYYVN